MSLVPMGWIECVLCEKLRCDFMAQTCALVAPVQPVLHRVSCSNETLTNAPKHYENTPKHEFRVQWGGSHVFVAKNSDASSWHELLHLLHQFGLFRTEFHAVTKKIQNAPKYYKTNQYMILGSNGIDWVRSLRKIPMRIYGTNLCINCTSSTRFAPSFM